MNASQPSSPSAPAMPLRDALRRVVLAWMFGAAWMYLASGAAFTRYAKLMDVTPFGFGLLAAIPFFAAAAQLPASLFIERYGHRKTIFLWTSTAHRLLWLPIAALPWILPKGWQWPGLLALMLASSVLASVATPAWMAWMADLVPGPIRGRYFSRRVQYGQAVGVVLTILTGLALDGPAPGQKTLLTAVIGALFAAAGVCGVIDILLFIRVPDVPRPRRPRLGFLELVRQPLASRSFRQFLGYSATMTLATGYIGQFIWLYLLDAVHMSNTRANTLLLTVPILLMMMSYPFWGRMVDRFGSKPTLLLAGILVVNGGTFWIFVTPTTWIPGYLCVLTATVAWPGMDIAGFNLLLRMAGTDARAVAGSAVIALNSMVVAVAGTASGFLGGAVAEWLGHDWQGHVLGWPITYHGVLFLLSAVLRLASLFWLLPLQEERNVATREALLYAANTLYSNLQLATALPLRMLTTVVRQTWRLPRRIGRWSSEMWKGGW